MARPSRFERNGRDFYPTPYQPVADAFPFFDEGAFEEPCAGDGALIFFVEALAAVYGRDMTCRGAFDVDPQADFVAPRDVLTVESTEADFFLTNPPWGRAVLEPMLDILPPIAPTWLILSIEIMSRAWSSRLVAASCTDIVPVGQVKWIPGSQHKSFGHCCWYRFAAGGRPGGPVVRYAE